MHEFESKNLNYRLIDESDRGFVEELYTTESRLTHIRETLAGIEAKDIVSRIVKSNSKKQGSFFWVAQHRKSYKAIGIVSAIVLPQFKNTAEIGVILHEKAEGRFYAFEALKTMFNYCFQNLSLDLIIETHSASNRAVCRLSERLGFKCKQRFNKSGQSNFLAHIQKSDWFMYKCKGTIRCK